MPATPILGWTQELGAGRSVQFWYEPDQSTYRIVYKDPVTAYVSTPQAYAPDGHLGAASSVLASLPAFYQGPSLAFITGFAEATRQSYTVSRLDLTDLSLTTGNASTLNTANPVSEESLAQVLSIGIRPTIDGLPTDLAYVLAGPGVEAALPQIEVVAALGAGPETPVLNIGGQRRALSDVSFAPYNAAIPASLAILSANGDGVAKTGAVALRAYGFGGPTTALDLLKTQNAGGDPLNKPVLSVVPFEARDLVLLGNDKRADLYSLASTQTGTDPRKLTTELLARVKAVATIDVEASLDALGVVAGGRRVYDLQPDGFVHGLLATDGTAAGTEVLRTLTLGDAATIAVAETGGGREILLVTDHPDTTPSLPVFSLLATDGSKAGTGKIFGYTARSATATAETIDLGDTMLLLVNDDRRAILVGATDGEALGGNPSATRLLTLAGAGVSLAALGEARGGELVLARTRQGFDILGTDGAPGHTGIVWSLRQPTLADAKVTLLDHVGDRALVAILKAGDLTLVGTDATAAGTREVTHLLLDAAATVAVPGHVQGLALVLVTQPTAADLYVTNAASALPPAILHLDLAAPGLQAAMLAEIGGVALLGLTEAGAWDLYGAAPDHATLLARIPALAGPLRQTLDVALPVAGPTRELIAVQDADDLFLFASDGTVAGTIRLPDLAIGPGATPLLLDALGGKAILQVAAPTVLDWYATDGATIEPLAHVEAGGDPITATLLLREAGHDLIGLTAIHAGVASVNYLVTDGTVAGTHLLEGEFDLAQWWL